MLEILRHALGLCGDGHTNLMWVLGINPSMLNNLIIKARIYWVIFISSARNRLKFLD